MKKISLLLALCAIFIQIVSAQTRVITTGNNLVNPADPYAADVVIGSDLGTRHDASIMWWSAGSASRISNTGDTFYLSRWSTNIPNVALSAVVGGSSYFNGNVIIGKTTQTNTGYRLDVAGNVRANQIVVNTTGADFVFDPSYQLLPLSDLQKYIDKNHHLPEIASAKQMQAAGLNVGDNQTKLLQKIEELTLYLIEKDKQVTELQNRVSALESTLHK